MKKIPLYGRFLLILLFFAPVCATGGHAASLSDLKLSDQEKAWLQDHPKIRIGVDPAYPPYSFVDSDGRYHGIAMEFADYFSKQLGIAMEVVPGLSWPEIVAAIKDQRLDVVASMTWRPERTAYVNFTEIYLPTPLVIMQRRGGPIHSEADLKGRTVALVKGYASAAQVMEEHPDVQPLMVETPKEALFAVATGKAQAYVGVLGINLYLTQKNGITNLAVAALYGGGAFGQRYGVRKDWPELASILDKALKALPEADRRAMFERWLPSTQVPDQIPPPWRVQTGQLDFTAQELAWLADHKQIEVGIMDAWPPFDFVDEEGRPQGIGMDFIAALNRRLGGVLVPAPGNWADIYKEVKEKRLAALLDITPKQERSADFLFTRPYLTVPHVIVARDDTPYLKSEEDLIGKTVALETDFGNVTYFKTRYPDVIIRQYNDTSAALGAVAAGEADAYAGNRAVAIYLIEKEVLFNLKVHGQLKKSGSVLAVGVRKDWPVFRDILQKALDDISWAERRQILGRWVTQTSGPAPVKLTRQERKWIGRHPVIRVSSEPDYAPFDFQRDGQPAGYSVDYVKLIAEKLGIRLQFVQDTWANLLDKSRRRELDLIHTIFNAPKSRDEFLTFTKPYKITAHAIITRADMTQITSVNDLNHRTVALVTDDSITDWIRQRFSGVIVLKVDTFEAALRAVAFGQADATIMVLPVANHLIRSLLLTNLKVAAEMNHPAKRNAEYRLAVRKDWPEFVPILEKAMESITQEELVALDSRWLVLPETVRHAVTPENVTQGRVSTWQQLLLAVLALILIAALLWLLLRLLDRSKKNPLTFQFASPSGRRSVILINALFIIIVAVLAWWALTGIKTRVKNDMRQSLQTVLQTTREAMNIWVRNHKGELDNIARDPRVIELTAGLLKHHMRGGDIANSHEFKELSDLFQEIRHRADHIGFFIIAPDGANIAAMDQGDIGRTNLIWTHRPNLLRRAFGGEIVLVPPMPSTTAAASAKAIPSQAHPPVMFFAAPVHDSKNRVIAVLADRFDPHGDFTRINLLGRIGKTGETYSFDRQGRLLSQSRFLHDLVSAGLVQSGGQSILTVQLRDPGSTLDRRDALPAGQSPETLPLTRMAASAIRGETGFDMAGYRDYRGVPVIGAWVWDKILDMGIASEMDLEEAMTAYHSARSAIGGLSAATVLISLAFTLLTITLGNRANRALRAANDQLEQRVQERTAELSKLSSAIEQSPTSVVITDKLGTIEYVNPTFTFVTGYSAEEVLGKNPRVLKSGRQSKAFYKELWTTITSGRTWTGDFQNRKKNGTLYWERAAIAPLLDASGRITHFVAVKEDITRRKQTEAALVEAKEQAEAANRAKSVFLANMSHEIRTPMNAILGYSQIMQHDLSLSPAQHKNLAIINRSGDHLLSLINDVLEMSKIESGRIELHPDPFDLHALMDDLSLMFRLRTEEKGLDFNIDQSENLPRYIDADEGKMRQVLINLLGNAVKFTTRGSIRLKAGLDEAQSPDGHLRLIFDVIDTGPGVAENQQEMIFGAFEQTENGRATEGGTGLGLTISRQYARLMGGDVTVTPSEQGGSIFRFEMTATGARAAQARSGTTEQRNVQHIDGSAAPRVLVVDDRPHNVEVLSQMLMRVGFKVSQAGDGLQAVDLFARERPDAVLMDVRMPEMDGVTATLKIRDMERNDAAARGRPAVIIAVSASSLESQRKAIMQPGLADAFIGKPFKEAEIYDTLRRHLGIDYVYDEATGDARPAPAKPSATAHIVAGLPEDLIRRLREATVRLDVDLFGELIPLVAAANADLAATLQRLVDGYDFETLEKLLVDSDGTVDPRNEASPAASENPS